MMNRHGCFSSEAELDAAIEAELSKLEAGQRERILLEFVREEGLSPCCNHRELL